MSARVESAELAQAAVSTIRLPLLVLDSDLCVVAANNSFYDRFNTTHEAVLSRPVYTLGDGQWDTPGLRSLLDKVLAQYAPADSCEIEQDIAGKDRCTILFNARSVFYERNARRMILLALKDVTQERADQQEMRELLGQKDVMLQELQHRVGNSLQLIASILLLKARGVQSEETRLHLQDAHGRVMSIAAVQKHLQVQGGDRVELDSYLSHLCGSLTSSLIGDTQPVRLTVSIAKGSAAPGEAVSMGLIVTELVINALKYAFGKNSKGGEIVVTYESVGAGWRLCVSDNGAGMPADSEEKSGLGTNIVAALAQQLDARVGIVSDARGYRTTITHGA